MYLKNNDGKVTETGEETANEFSRYFGSVYTEEDTKEIPEFDPVDMQKPDSMENIVRI